MTHKIGFIGLGAMGLPMLENLARQANFDLRAFDTSDTPFARLAEHPEWGKSLTRADAMNDMADRDIVILMLPNSAITNRVVLGSDGTKGLADILSDGSKIIDMGSSDPLETRKLNTTLEARGIYLVDAPVSGAVARAATGKLAIMFGGNDDALGDVRPVLETMGSDLFAVGLTGDAHAMKALNNYVYAAGLLAMSEALCIAEQQGLSLDHFVDVLNASSGRNVATDTKAKQFILPETYDAGFLMRLQAKDLRIADMLGRDAGVPATLLDLCTSRWKEAEAAQPDADNTAIHKYIKTLAAESRTKEEKSA
ncbi:MAG TPA: NAD(P)-dependent oxidoreductase [Sulfitobacter sp.]|uniref:NAD(P)-dependent oxidoreductase n=1 Tax=Sulfitobacter dubius TaxID=218673 RepID=UPI000E98769F|nr:NAD(P)-dependent oxidoreductase [Sulfitobacter sp.]